MYFFAVVTVLVPKVLFYASTGTDGTFLMRISVPTVFLKCRVLNSVLELSETKNFAPNFIPNLKP